MDTRDCSRTRERAIYVNGARFGMAVSVAILIGGCSSVPDAANPVEWYKSAERTLFGGGGTASEAEAASSNAGAPAYTPPEIPSRDQAFPNLGEGPERPVPRTPAETEQLRQGLVADRARALHSNRSIPLQGMSGERTAGLPMSDGDLPLGPGASAIPAAPTSAEVIRTQLGQAPGTEGGAPRPADSRRPSNPAGAGERAAPGSNASAAASTPRQTGGAPNRPAFSDAPPPSGTSAPPPRPQFADVAPTTLGLSSASPPARQPTRVDPPVAAASELPPPPPLRSAASGMNAASGPTSDNSEGVPDGSAAREDAPNNPIESVERTAALEQANPPTAKSERSDRIATIQFRGETTELGDAERDVLRQVAALHQQRGGMIRVVGRHGGAPDQDKSAEDQVSLERANAVAQELIRLGVSRQNVRASADATGAEKMDTRTAEIYFIY